MSRWKTGRRPVRQLTWEQQDLLLTHDWAMVAYRGEAVEHVIARIFGDLETATAGYWAHEETLKADPRWADPPATRPWGWWVVERDMDPVEAAYMTDEEQRENLTAQSGLLGVDEYAALWEEGQRRAQARAEMTMSELSAAENEAIQAEARRNASYRGGWPDRGAPAPTFQLEETTT